MTTRITGLVSNLDVDALVEAGASYYQNKLDKAKQDEQVAEWKQEQYKAIESDVTDFYDKYLYTTSSDSLFNASNWSTIGYTSSDSTAVTATSDSTAKLDNYSISVTQLASAATKTLTATDYANGLSITGGTMKSSASPITLSTTEISGCSSMSAVATLLNTKLNGTGMTATYSQLSGGIVVATSALGSSSTLKIQDSSGTSTIADVTGNNLHATITDGSNNEYIIGETTTTGVDQSAYAKNSISLDGVTFNFKDTTTSSSESTNYLTSSSINSLLGDHIKKIDTTHSSDATNAYTVYTLDNTAGNKIKIASDGTITLMDSSGGTITSDIALESSDGTTKTIKSGGTVTTTAASNNAVTLTGSTDVSDLQDKIESFINDYNTLMKTVDGKIYETYDSDYKPLTDAEKEDMSESEITKWETKAKTGLLRHDSYLEKLVSDMKDSMSTLMSGSGISIERIGMAWVDDYTTKYGTFTIDSTKLKSALEGTVANKTGTYSLDDIKSLFTKASSTITSYTDTYAKTDGILAKLKVGLNNNVYMATSALSKKAGNDEHASTLKNNEIYDYLDEQADLIDELEEKLEDKEDSLYAKYSTLETNLSKLQSSSSLFSSSSSS